MTDLELGWVAGLLEGEGCFRIRKANHSYPMLHMGSTDQDIIEKLCRLIGGVVYGPYKKKAASGNDCKPFWRWEISAAKPALEVLKMIQPLMGQRRQTKIAEVIKECEKPHVNAWKLKTKCKRGHEYTEENTRYYPNGRRLCRTCNKEYRRNKYAGTI